MDKTGYLLDPTHVTRPDILYGYTRLSGTSVGKINPTVMMAQFAKNPSQENWPGVKRILRYLKGTIDFVLTCRGQKGNWKPELAFP